MTTTTKTEWVATVRMTLYDGSTVDRTFVLKTAAALVRRLSKETSGENNKTVVISVGERDRR